MGTRGSQPHMDETLKKKHDDVKEGSVADDVEKKKKVGNANW